MKKFLAAVDFSGVTDAVVSTAAELARLQDGHLYLVHSTSPEPDFVGYEPGPEYIRDRAAAELHELHGQLHQLANGLRLPDDRVTALLVSGPPGEKLLQEQERLGVDMMIIGSHGHGALYKLLVGGVANEVLRKATCPVLVVPTPRSRSV